MGNPVDSFLHGMQSAGAILRGRRQEERDDKLFDMRTAAYDRQRRREDEADARAAKKRTAASALARINAGMATAEDVAQYGGPQAGTRFGDLAGARSAETPQDGEPDLAAALDEQAQRQAVSYVLPLIDAASQGKPLEDKDREPLWAAGAALHKSGVLAGNVPAIRNQAQATGEFKQTVAQLGQTVGPQLLGKKTVIDEAHDTELFRMFSAAFPAVANGSKAFKDGNGRPVQFYVDATGVDKIQDARIYTVLEGTDPQTGKPYRAPMTARRGKNDDDPVAGETLGNLYAQADFAERASKAILASIAGLDDAVAERTLERYWAMADKIAEEKYKLAKNARLGQALAGISGFNAEEQKSLSEAVAAGGNPKDTADMILKARGKKDVKLVWRDNVLGKDDKPYQVAYDENTGKEVARVPQWVKDGDGSGGRGKGGLKDADYKIFDDQLNKQFLGEYLQTLPAEQREMADLMETDALGNSRVAMERVVAKMQAEMRERYNAARQAGENFMADGSLTPVLAANKAYQFANQKSGGEVETSPLVFSKATPEQVMSALEEIPDVPARLEQVRRYLASDAPEEAKEKVRYQYEAQLAKIQAGGASDKRRAAYAQGMEQRPTPEKVRDKIFTGLQQNVPDYSPYDIPGVGGALTGLDQIADFFFISPAAAAGSGVAGLLRDFQKWAQAGGFNNRQQAVAAYAQENPERAQKIAAAAR